MNQDDLLILGTAAVIALNRLYSDTRLVRRNEAYVGVQALNLIAAFALYFVKIEGFGARLDHVVRLFLLGVVAFHMVHNHMARQAAELRAKQEARREEERRREKEEMRRNVEAAAALFPDGIGGDDFEED